MMGIDSEEPDVIMNKVKVLVRRAAISLTSLIIIDLSFIICYTGFMTTVINKPCSEYFRLQKNGWIIQMILLSVTNPILIYMCIHFYNMGIRFANILSQSNMKVVQRAKIIFGFATFIVSIDFVL